MQVSSAAPYASTNFYRQHRHNENTVIGQEKHGRHGRLIDSNIQQIYMKSLKSINDIFKKNFARERTLYLACNHHPAFFSDMPYDEYTMRRSL